MRLGKPTRFVAIQEHDGDWCGHWHRYFDRACQCARRQERLSRIKYNDRRDWLVHTYHAQKPE